MEIRKIKNWRDTYPLVRPSAEWLSGRDLPGGIEEDLLEHRRRIFRKAKAYWERVMPGIEAQSVTCAATSYHSNGKFIIHTHSQDYVLDPAGD